MTEDQLRRAKEQRAWRKNRRGNRWQRDRANVYRRQGVEPTQHIYGNDLDYVCAAAEGQREGRAAVNQMHMAQSLLARHQKTVPTLHAMGDWRSGILGKEYKNKSNSKSLTNFIPYSKSSAAEDKSEEKDDNEEKIEERSEQMDDKIGEVERQDGLSLEDRRRRRQVEPAAQDEMEVDDDDEQDNDGENDEDDSRAEIKTPDVHMQGSKPEEEEKHGLDADHEAVAIQPTMGVRPQTDGQDEDEDDEAGGEDSDAEF